VRKALRDLADGFPEVGRAWFDRGTNQVMFAGTDALPAADERNRIADSAVNMLLATYG
jgi:hypothetical protein